MAGRLGTGLHFGKPATSRGTGQCVGIRQLVSLAGITFGNRLGALWSILRIEFYVLLRTDLVLSAIEIKKFFQLLFLAI